MMRSRPDGDAGATAVVTAVLVVVLFGFAALAVDLTNQFSRDRASQTTADLAALAGAGDLPKGCLALTTAIAYMTGPNNRILFDEANSGVGPGALTDGLDANGEIRVHDSASIPDFGGNNPNPLSGCPGVVNTGNAITVFSPPQEVDYAFAPVLGLMNGTAGPTSGRVASAATAFREGGFERKLLPFGLPSGCLNGSNLIKTPPPGKEAAGELCGSSATGNFGYLDSPRAGLKGNAAFEQNLAVGLDHAITSFANGAVLPPGKCSEGVDGARLDTSSVRVPPANCVDVKTGNITSGIGSLITGYGSGSDRQKGRLTGISEPPRDAGGAARCTEPGVGPGGESDFRWTVPKKGKDSISVTNTTLSCYVQGGLSGLPGLATKTPPVGVVDASILNDPRFFFVPVLAPSGRSQNGDWPVIGFRAAFITSESVSGGVGQSASCAPSTCNGLVFGSGGNLDSVGVFVFEERAIKGSSPGGGGFTSLLR